MEQSKQESEAEASQVASIHPSTGLQNLPPQPRPFQPFLPPGIKRGRTESFDAEREADESSDMPLVKTSRDFSLSEHKLPKENLPDGLKATITEPSPKDLCTCELVGGVCSCERKQQSEMVRLSESQGTPKLYLGHGMEAGDESAWRHFADFLTASSRVLCLVGAGLSAPSGLATWRGANGLWNDISLKELASPKKFEEDPVTVWHFYGDRILESLAAQPNAAHHALGTLARWHGEWLTINQNVDGLLEQTEHPASSLLGIHGTLKNVRCTACDYNVNVTTPHDIPFLLSLSNANSQSRSGGVAELPHCPQCTNLLRPGVVWFGELLAAGAPDSIDEWFSEDQIDLVIVAGTSLEVFPAAEWVGTAREYGASLAIFDTDYRLGDELDDNDWFFHGDAAMILPRIVDLLRS